MYFYNLVPTISFSLQLSIVSLINTNVLSRFHEFWFCSGSQERLSQSYTINDHTGTICDIEDNRQEK